MKQLLFIDGVGGKAYMRGALGVAGFNFAHDGMVTAEEACALPVAKRIAVSASHGFIPSNKNALVAMRDWFDETSA